MSQRDERVVVDGDAGAARVELGVDAPYRPEQEQRLIDQVAAEIEQQAAGFVGPVQHPPPAFTAGRQRS